MKKTLFDFNGDWEFELELENFRIFNDSEYIRGSEKQEQGLFDFQIFDERNSNPDPEEYQINTINYILDSDNQTKVLRSLLKYSKEIIYPHYKTFMWESEYPDCYPELNKVEDLHKLYGINRITIKTIGHENFAYYIFNCSSCLDHEHGIILTFFKDKIIDHGEAWDDKKVCEHKGIDYKTYHEKAVKDYNHKELILTEPHQKYGKLKPWQKDQNDYYPFGLFHAKKDEELISGIESGIIPREPIQSRILGMAIWHERERLTQWLITQNPEGKYSAFKEALNKDRFDLMDSLLKIGYNINEKVASSSHFYETIGLLEKSLSEDKGIDNYKKRLNYLVKKGLDPKLEDNWKRNSFDRIKRVEDKNIRTKVEKAVMDSIKTESGIFERMKNKFKKR